MKPVSTLQENHKNRYYQLHNSNSTTKDPPFSFTLSHFTYYNMFRNTFQSGFLSILYSIGSKPLQIWDKKGTLL